MLRLIIIVYIYMFSVNVFSKTIDENSAKQLAVSVVHEDDLILVKKTKTFYIFTNNDNNSFAIIASDDSVGKLILGYSESSGWLDDKMPTLLNDWLDSLDNSQKKYEPQLQKTFSKNNAVDNKKNIPVLLKSRWHQDSPYNDLCPVIADGNIKTAAGCVAIAAGQVAYYWKKDNPQFTSDDTPTYPYGSAPVTYSVPKGTEYQWELMKDYYNNFESEEEKQAVARLIYIIGTSAYLQYGSSTGGQIDDVVSPFSKQLKLNAKKTKKSDYSQSGWEQLIYDNLLKSRPVVYAGSTGNSGHAVVIDGYNAALNLFHFNFGWGGSGDGYYTIDDATGMNGYSSGQECLCDIYPQKLNMEVSFSINDELAINTPSMVNISIRNGSTLDIEGLHLFVNKGMSIPNKVSDAVWSYSDKIKSDGIENVFTAEFTPTIFGQLCYLILTDNKLNILSFKKISISESSSVNPIDVPINSASEYYSLKGIKTTPGVGVYIQKSSKGIRKKINN